MERDPTKPIALSTNSANTFNSCERKGYHRYFAKTGNDLDWTRPNYYGFGSAFHEVLEKCKHDSKRFRFELVVNACEKECLNLDSDAPKLLACLRSYWLLSAESALVPLHFEHWFENDLACGKVDLILENPADGTWLICDTKTSGISLSATKRIELINDPQMNLYGAFHDVIAERLGLEADKWQGIAYREIEKPKQKYKLGESFEEFHARVSEKGNPKYREIILPKEELKWDNAYQNFLMTVKRARELQQEFINGTPTTSRQNFQSCKKFGTPCEYWSKCYDCLYTSQQSEKTVDILSIL